MIARKQRVVLDLQKWSAGYGESSVAFHVEGLNLTVNVSYGRQVSRQKADVTLLFANAFSHYVSCVPGVELLDIEYERDLQSDERFGAPGRVVEYEDSEVAQAWAAAFPWTETPIRHFQVIFCNQNQIFEVFAETFSYSVDE